MLPNLLQSRNMWGRWESGIYTRNFPIDGLVLYLPLYQNPDYVLLNGTGIASGAPVVLLTPGNNTITVTQAGTFTITLPTGVTGTATSGTATITGSPQSLVGGLNTITAEGTGNFTVSVPIIVSKEGLAHLCTVTGATWGTTGRYFDGSDLIDLGTNSVLDLTGSFSLCVWLNPDNLINPRYVYGKDSFQTAGILLGLTTVGAIDFYTSQDSAFQQTKSSNGVIAAATWAMVGVSREGTDVKLYKNGVVQTEATSGVHQNPASSAHSSILGAGGDLEANKFLGSIGEFWLYSGKVLAASEFQNIYDNTKWRY